MTTASVPPVEMTVLPGVRMRMSSMGARMGTSAMAFTPLSLSTAGLPARSVTAAVTVSGPSVSVLKSAVVA